VPWTKHKTPFLITGEVGFSVSNRSVITPTDGKFASSFPSLAEWVSRRVHLQPEVQVKHHHAILKKQSQLWRVRELLLVLVLLVSICSYPQESAARSPEYYDNSLKVIKRDSKDDGELADRLYDLWLERRKDQSDSTPIFKSKDDVIWPKSVEQQLEIQNALESLANTSKDPHTKYTYGHLRYYLGSDAMIVSEMDRGDRKYDLSLMNKKKADEDFKAARKLFERTIYYPPSASMLGMMHEKGLGVPQSNYVAIECYYKAGVKYYESGMRNDALRMLEKINRLDAKHALGVKLSNVLIGSASAPSAPKEKKTARTELLGTGWFCKHGLIITNYHVVEGRKEISVLMGGRKYSGALVAKDKVNDIALIRVNNLSIFPKAIPFASSKAAVAAEVFTLGFPHPDIMGVSPKYSSGKISSLTGIGDDPRTYQISVPLQSGNSGGPLINMNGEAVGLVTAKLDAVKVFQWTGDLPQNVNYGIKIDYVKTLLEMVEPLQPLETLSAKPGTPEELVKRVENSIVCVVCR
jgi:hypothetical protein